MIGLSEGPYPEELGLGEPPGGPVGGIPLQGSGKPNTILPRTALYNSDVSGYRVDARASLWYLSSGYSFVYPYPPKICIALFVTRRAISPEKILAVKFSIGFV